MPRRNSNVEKPTAKPKPVPDKITTLTNLLYEAAKKRGDAPLYPALRKKMNDITSEVSDMDEIELVCLTIIDDSIDFASWKNLAWTSYEYMRNSLEVPDGAWKFALWAYHLTNGQVRESINYWLGVWYDAVQSDEEYQRDRAKNQLDNLWMKHKEPAKQVTW